MMKMHYYDMFEAYQKSNLDYLNKVIQSAILASVSARKQVTENLDFIFATWSNQTSANDQRKHNTKKALEWICHNPAFTSQQLTNALGVCSQTTTRIIKKLSDLEIISSSKKVHIDGKDTPEKIWEAHQIYELAESLESEIHHALLTSTPPRFNPPDTTSSMTKVGKTAKAAELRNTIASCPRSPYPIMVLPSNDKYSYGISLFEFFVICDGHVELRTPLQECLASLTEQEGFARFNLELRDRITQGWHSSEYSSTVASCQDTVSFVEAVNNNIVQTSNVKRNWDNIWRQFANLISIHSLWDAIEELYKQSSETLDNPLPPYFDTMRGSIEQSLIFSITSFIHPQTHRAITEHEASEQWLTTHSVCLLDFIIALQNSIDTQTLLSTEQTQSLSQMRQELKKIGTPWKIWNPLKKTIRECQQDFSVPNNTQLEEQIKNLAKETITGKIDQGRLMSEYLRTLRNTITHGASIDVLSRTIIEEYEITHGKATIIQKAMETIYGFIKRIHSEVFALKGIQLDNNLKKIEHESTEYAKICLSTIRRTH